MILIIAHPYTIAGYWFMSLLLFTETLSCVMQLDMSWVNRFFLTRSPVSVKPNWSARLQGCNIAPFIFVKTDLRMGTEKPYSTSLCSFFSSSSSCVYAPLWFPFWSCASSSAIFSSEVSSRLYLYSIPFWWMFLKKGNKSCCPYKLSKSSMGRNSCP